MIISLQVTNENDMQFERNWIKSLQIGISLLQSLNRHNEKVDKYDNCQDKKRFTKNADLLRNSQHLIILDHGFIRISNLVVTIPSALCSSTETSLISFNCLLTVENITAKSYTLYKNTCIRTTRLKFAQKLRTSKEQLRLGFRCKCDCNF